MERAPSKVIGAVKERYIFAPSAMMMADDDCGIVDACPAGKAGALRGVGIFGREQRAAAEKRVKRRALRADSVERSPAEGEAGSLDRAGGQEAAGREAQRLCRFVDRNPGIVGIVEQHPAGGEADRRIGERRLDRDEDVGCDITIVVGEQDEFAACGVKPGVASVAEAKNRLPNPPDWKGGSRSEAFDGPGGAVARAIVDDHQLPFAGMVDCADGGKTSGERPGPVAGANDQRKLHKCFLGATAGIGHAQAPMPQSGLATKVSRSARWAFVESLVSAGASLVSVVALARLLTPGEFGQAGLAMALAAIVQAALLGGMPDALVRARSGHTRLTDAAFWAMLAIGLAGAVLCGLAGLFVAAVLGDTALGALITAAGAGCIAVGAAAAPTGILLRKMRTRALVGRTAWSKLAGLAASLTLALAGAGAWALVLGAVAAQAAAAGQLVATMRRPGLRWGAAGLGEVLRIGLLSGAQACLGTLTSRGFLLAFGAVYGAHAVGLFNFALRLVEESCGLVIQTLRRVTVTSFAAAKRQGADLPRLFARGTHLIAFIAAPLFLGGAAIAPDAVPLVFGAQWAAAVPAMQLMLAMWLVRAVRMLVNATMLVEGRQRAMTALAGIGAAATAIAFLVSLPFGVAASTAAYAATLVGVAFGGRAFARVTGIGIAAQLGPALRPVAIALAMVGVVTALRLGPLAGWAGVWRLAALVAAGMAAYAGAALLFDRPGLARVQSLLRR